MPLLQYFAYVFRVESPRFCVQAKSLRRIADKLLELTG